jgi:hypothetical protein
MNDIIFYKGRYWLAEKYDDNLYGGGWFASPIYETETGLEVRPAGGDWCYKSNGAIISEILPNEKLEQIYCSWQKHLEWTCGIIEKYNGECKKAIEDLHKNINHFSELIKKLSFA